MKKKILHQVEFFCLVFCIGIAVTNSSYCPKYCIDPVHTMGSIVSDLNFTEQWALYNKGTLKLVEMNQYKQAVEGIDIDVINAWKEYKGGNRETIVALIDTGVDYHHEDLADSIWVNEDEIPGDGIDNDGNGYVDDRYGWNFFDNNNEIYGGKDEVHGTHDAGTIIAARDNEIGIAGIAGNSSVKIMIVKALGGEEGIGTTEAIVKAVRYAKENGAVICNLSFGTDVDDPKLKQVIAESDMLFIAAAGNGDSWTQIGHDIDQTPIYPASYDLDNIITVANLDYDGTLHYTTNYGIQNVDLAAPGSYIISTLPENEYGYMTGSSMATPMVTGTAALLYSQFSDITLEEVRNRILSSAKPLYSLTNKVGTGGMLDAYAAFTWEQ